MNKQLRRERLLLTHLLFSCAVMAVLMGIPAIAKADCTGEVRDTTETERESYDWVDREFPKLLGASDDYVFSKSRMSVSRNSRCFDMPDEPLYLSSRLQFMLHGKALEKQQEEEKRLMDSFQGITKKMQEMQKSGMDIMTIMARIESEQKQLERESNALQAKREIKIDAYFNNSSAECRGEAMDVPGVLVACRLMGDDEREHMHLLFGSWQKGETGQWSYAGMHDFSRPTHKIQTIEINMSGTSAALKSVIEHSDWSAINALIAN